MCAGEGKQRDGGEGSLWEKALEETGNNDLLRRVRDAASH